ncbi:MAG TPA: hypothetical protein VMF52_00355 [Steroidobacteraceae bacterium]|nr:hypothetical protein [Steroidobacteraceae bacterium]
MNSERQGGLDFLGSWSDDLDPAARHPVVHGEAVIDLDGVYLPDGDAPAVAARNGAARGVAVATLHAVAAWLMIRAR